MIKMKTTLLLTLALLLCSSVVIAQEQKKAEPEHKLIQFQLALLKRGPKWTANFGKDAPELQKQHVDYVQKIIASGQLVIAGRIQDDNELAAVYIFRTTSAEEAQKWINDDPVVAGGYLVPELHPWWSEDVMKKTATPTKLTTAYLAFLTRGEKWSAERTPASAEIQKAHLANIQKLADMKKLVVAGPFGDNGRLRGIFVFKVNSLEEAKALAATDPAVQAGRLALEIHPWLIPEGILP